ncbi:hypothetical protein SISNIDRAFT_450575 [Sistotremastrum niveocremeum HHB9708]|uniref:Secreted protein n=1 Tax=Sistotremastrum niveocremeum HHB9708 TaxID=1314777 RepID=A0A164YE22_9AGAM|nr:hypothetical protein SISNIDRAFT_450575 [Sistotremastrum niveocremeum HHB9708]
MRSVSRNIAPFILLVNVLLWQLAFQIIPPNQCREARLSSHIHWGDDDSVSGKQLRDWRGTRDSRKRVV